MSDLALLLTWSRLSGRTTRNTTGFSMLCSLNHYNLAKVEFMSPSIIALRSAPVDSLLPVCISQLQNSACCVII